MKSAVPAFKRKNIVIEDRSFESQAPVLHPSVPLIDQELAECNVLVINADHDMAKELTLQLSIQIPGCSILFAPT
ncbi:MAG: hypothetical protein KDD62_06485, partial [Bdellovibrionales bacterium]|nr:hypothetical protein [Bdellovibrionales bacterium]